MPFWLWIIISMANATKIKWQLNFPRIGKSILDWVAIFATIEYIIHQDAMNVKCATSLFFWLSDCGKDYAANVKANHNDSFQAANCLSRKGKNKAEDADGGQYDQIINGGGIYPDGVYCR